LWRNEPFEPCGFEDALFADEYEDLLVDDVVEEPRSDHSDEPFGETFAPDALLFFVSLNDDLFGEPSDPVGLFRVVGCACIDIVSEWIDARDEMGLEHREDLSGSEREPRFEGDIADDVVDVRSSDVRPDSLCGTKLYLVRNKVVAEPVSKEIIVSNKIDYDLLPIDVFFLFHSRVD